MLELGIAGVVSLAIWAYLVAGHGGFWRTGHRLPPATGTPATGTPATGTPATGTPATGKLATGKPGAGAEPGPGAWPGVVAVVPARNEAAVLPGTLPGLLGQDYPGAFRVILVDDGSDDGTGEIAAKLGEKSAAELTVLSGRPRPDGWAGKVWAMSQGFAALATDNSKKNGDKYVLFTDADIAWTPRALRRLVVAAEADDRQLLSQMVLLRAATAWEKHIVPAFVYFFAQLYPFRRASDPRSRTAASAGGCQLINAEALRQAGGLEPVKGALIDDVALATLLKRDRNRIWLGLTTEITSARPYPRLKDLWHMIARSAYCQLRYSPFLLAGTILGMLLIYAVPPAAAVAGLITGSALSAVAGLAAWALMAASYAPMLRLYRLSVTRAPLLPLIGMLYTAMVVDSARRYYVGHGVVWRLRSRHDHT